MIYLRRRLDRALDREHELATTNPLTGLLNRRGLEARVAELVARAARRGVMLGVIVADVDHFKRVNDLHGHLVGDEVLRQVAQAVKGCVRADDLVVRLGGEEFAVVLVLVRPSLRGREADPARGASPVHADRGDDERRARLGHARGRR